MTWRKTKFVNNLDWKHSWKMPLRKEDINGTHKKETRNRIILCKDIKYA
jgi:hypothetical protein